MIPLKKVKVIISVLILIYTIFWIMNIGFIQGLLVPNNYTLILGSLIILFLVFSYFYSLLVRNKLIVLQREPLVWISCGALFYNLGCLPYFIWFNKLVTSSQEKAYAFLILVVILNTIMYSLFTIAFLWKKIY